ncbi:MAG: hypothetical protein CMD15_05430 [Flavobacteriales bacterium]|nr:hypothetical protein [Flavobacteriales bacterium]
MIGGLNKTLALLLIFPMTVVSQEFDIKEIDLDFNDIKTSNYFSLNFILKNEKANQLFQKTTNQIKSECNYYTAEGEAVYNSCPKSQYKGKTGFYICENSGFYKNKDRFIVKRIVLKTLRHFQKTTVSL